MKAELSSTHVGPSVPCEDSGSLGRARLVCPFWRAASECASPAIRDTRFNGSKIYLLHLILVQTGKRSVECSRRKHKRWQQIRHLLVVGGVPRQVGEVNELHVEGPELSQDAAARRGPAPVTADAAGGGEERK